MKQTIEQIYQEIGKAALGLANELSGKLLIYAEVEEGVISADVFFTDNDGIVQFRFCPKNLQELIYSLWEQWRDNPRNNEWRIMCYVINNGKFTIDLTYPNQIKQNEDTSDRRPLLLKHYFGDAQVDYSKPK